MKKNRNGEKINLLVYPSTLENASRVTKIANSLQKNCSFSETHAVGIHRKGLPEEESISENTFIVRVKGSGMQGVLGKVFKFLLWQPSVYLKYRNCNLAVVACHNVWALPMCSMLANTTKAKLIYNAHELETEAGGMHGFKKKLAKIIERKYIFECSIVSVVSNSISDWYSKEYSIPKPLVVRNISVDSRVKTSLRSKLNLSESELLFVHTGKLTAGRNIPLILDTFKPLNDKHVAFIGNGPLAELVESAASTNTNIHLLPMVPTDEVVSNMREADVGICLTNTSENLSQQYAGPNKLFEALGANTPIICTDLPEANYLLGNLASKWIIKDPNTQFGRTVKAINKCSVSEFRKSFQGIPTWDEEIMPLVMAYQNL